jgi:hypothetical protein
MAEQAGFSGRDALRVVRAFTAYAIGAATTAAQRANVIQALELDGAALPELPDAAEFPRIAALGSDLFVIDESDFEFGLDLLIAAVSDLRGSR